MRIIRALNGLPLEQLAWLCQMDSIFTIQFLQTQTREDLISRVLEGVEKLNTCFPFEGGFLILASGGQIHVAG